MCPDRHGLHPFFEKNGRLFYELTTNSGARYRFSPYKGIFIRVGASKGRKELSELTLPCHVNCRPNGMVLIASI